MTIHDTTEEDRCLVCGDRGDRIVHISEVVSGLACGCHCPVCGRRLVPKKGTEVGHHFAHESDSDCKGAAMTLLHLMFQQALMDLGRVWVPALYAVVLNDRREEEVVVAKAGYMLFLDDVRLENRIDLHDGQRCIADVAAMTCEGEIIIEIVVTHDVDDWKRDGMQDSGRMGLIIDASKVSRQVGPGTVRKIVTDELVRKARGADVSWFSFNERQRYRCLIGARWRELPARKMLWRAAQREIASSKEIWLPPSYIVFGTRKKNVCILEEGFFETGEVINDIDSILSLFPDVPQPPDSIVSLGGRKTAIYLMEDGWKQWRKTRIDWRSLEALHRSGMPGLELDLIVVDSDDESSLSDTVLGQSHAKRWIWHPDTCNGGVAIHEAATKRETCTLDDGQYLVSCPDPGFEMSEDGWVCPSSCLERCDQLCFKDARGSIFCLYGIPCSSQEDVLQLIQDAKDRR